MSADNWSKCPRCARLREEKLAALDLKIAQSYGSVSIEAFDQMRTEREALASDPLDRTVREDYEFWGIEEGEFNARYRAKCTACGFEHSFDHSEEADA
jgi:hypothetical protein